MQSQQPGQNFGSSREFGKVPRRDAEHCGERSRTSAAQGVQAGEGQAMPCSPRAPRQLRRPCPALAAGCPGRVCLGLCSRVAPGGGIWLRTHHSPDPPEPPPQTLLPLSLFLQKSPAPAQLFLLRGEYNGKMLLGSYFCFQNLNK